MTDGLEPEGGAARDNEAGDAMHLHRPKPLHGWREVLLEIGVIAVGIVIAIGFEQVVEQIHWANEVSVARASLANEIADDDRALAFRVKVGPCIARRLDVLEDVIEKTAKHEPVPRLGPVMADTGEALTDNIWQANRASQTLTHFDEAELELFSAYYEGLGYIRTGLSSEADNLGVIRVLQGDPARLGPSDIANLRVVIQRARFANVIVAALASGGLKTSNRLHIDVPAPDASRIKTVCEPLLIRGGP